MLLRGVLSSLLAIVLYSSPASAAELKFFASAFSAPSSQFYFYLPSNPLPTSVNSSPMWDSPSFTIADVTLYDYDTSAGFYPVTDDVTFYAQPDGGFSITKGYNPDGTRYFGPTLFSGTLDDPVFAPGVFQLQNNVTQTFSAFTISAVGTAPEPAAWVMMISGFAVVGQALRRLAPRSALPA